MHGDRAPAASSGSTEFPYYKDMQLEGAFEEPFIPVLFLVLSDFDEMVKR